MANDELIERLHKALSKCPINGSFSKGSLADYLNPILSVAEPLIRADERESQAAEIEALKHDLARSMETANAYLNERESLTRRVAELEGPYVTPRPRNRTATQEKVAKCPRCRGDIGAAA